MLERQDIYNGIEYILPYIIPINWIKFQNNVL